MNDARWIERAEILREKGTDRGDSSAGRWTSTRGWTSGRATCRGNSRRVPLGAARDSPGSDPGYPASDLGVLQSANSPARAAAQSALQLPFVRRTLRAGLSHVLPGSALAQRSPGSPRAPLRTRNHRRLPLSARCICQRWVVEAGGREGDCPVTEQTSEHLLRLPFYNELGASDQARIVTALFEFRTAKAIHA